jgi:hypothetical protein
VTIVAHELRASYAFIERNFFLTRRYWGWEVAFLIYSVAGALSISLIGADQGDPILLLTLMVGAIFWNYLSVVFSWIAETISVERWEGTLEYTFMAPIRRVRAQRPGQHAHGGVSRRVRRRDAGLLHPRPDLRTPDRVCDLPRRRPGSGLSSADLVVRRPPEAGALRRDAARPSSGRPGSTRYRGGIKRTCCA